MINVILGDEYEWHEVEASGLTYYDYIIVAAQHGGTMCFRLKRVSLGED